MLTLVGTRNQLMTPEQRTLNLRVQLGWSAVETDLLNARDYGENAAPVTSGRPAMAGIASRPAHVAGEAYPDEPGGTPTGWIRLVPGWPGRERVPERAAWPGVVARWPACGWPVCGRWSAGARGLPVAAGWPSMTGQTAPGGCPGRAGWLAAAPDGWSAPGAGWILPTGGAGPDAPTGRGGHDVGAAWMCAPGRAPWSGVPGRVMPHRPG